MRKWARVSVIIPALNEELAIGRVIADIPAWVDEIVVVDNGSTDATGAVAASMGARVVVEYQRGYGAACQLGIAAARDADIIVFLDGDYSDYPHEMAALVDPIVAGAAEIVIGSRVTGAAEPRALLPQQRFGNWLACSLMRLLFSATFTDLGPFRAIRTEALQRLKMHDRAYGWTVEMQIKAVKARLAIQEVPVSYRPRVGVSKISGTVRGSILAGITILAVIAKSIPLKRQALLKPY